jgi:hypothetical protein
VIETYIRSAFAGGYAEVGEDVFPAPAFVEAWLRAATESAATVHDQTAAAPTILLEAARLTGKRAGVMATQAKHRRDLDRRWEVKAQPIWRDMARWAAPEIARAIKPHEAEGDDIASKIRKVFEGIPASIRSTWAKVTRGAMEEGAAQGSAIGQIWIATESGAKVIPSYGLTFDSALSALRNLDKLPGWLDPNSWQAQQVNGMVYQLGQKLGDAVEQGLNSKDVLGIVNDAITGDQSMAALMLDSAISNASTQGSLALYDSEGVEKVDILTADDPCPDCESAADNGPYAVDVTPDVPVHPRCRCAVAPDMR